MSKTRFPMAMLGLLLAGTASAQQADVHDQIRFSAEYQIEQNSNRGVILLTADIAEGNHIYAVPRKKSPPQKPGPKSKIRVKKNETFAVTASFIPDQKPSIEFDPSLQAEVAKHRGKVVFWAPIELTDGQSAEDLKIDLKFAGVVCSGNGCFPIFDRPIEVLFGGYYQPKTADK